MAQLQKIASKETRDVGFANISVDATDGNGVLLLGHGPPPV